MSSDEIILPSDYKFLDSFRKTIQNKVELVETEKDDRSHEFEIFTRAPNAIEWVVGKNYANHPESYNHFGQYQLIRDLFELLCPVCANAQDENCFYIDEEDAYRTLARETLESQPLLVWSNKWEDDVCPSCGTTREEFEDDGLMNGYNQIHGVIGMRAGKSDTMGLVGTYVEHAMLCIGHTHSGGLHGYFGIPEHEMFEITYLASSETQGAETIWSKYTGRRFLSPWIKKYVDWVKNQESEQDTLMRKWRYAETDTVIRNEHPNIRLRLNSWNTNSGSLVGKTRIAGFLDELSRMKQTDSASGAREVYNGLEASLRTIRSRARDRNLLRWLGLMASVTSPIAMNDMGMELLETGKRISKMFTIHKATWEFNPHEPESGFKDDFKKAPILAKRNFQAQPPESQFPLILDKDRFKEAAVTLTSKATAEFEIYPRVAKTGHRYTAIRMIHADFDPNEPRFLVFDAGKNFDAFSGSCGHKRVIRAEDGDIQIITVFDWVIRIIPADGTEVYFSSVVDIVRKLKQVQIIERVEFDNWNSTQAIQDIREMGIPAESRNTKFRDYTKFVQDSYEGKIEMLPELPEDDGIVQQPLMSAQKIAIVELCELEQDPITMRVFNPHKGEKKGWHSNDTAQVAVNTHRLVQRSAFVEKYSDRSKAASLKRSVEGGSRFSTRRGGRIFTAGSRGNRKW
jgi:hypothetical protein